MVAPSLVIAISLGYLLLYMDMGYFLGLYQDEDLGGSGSLHLLSPDGSVIAAMAGGGLLAQHPAQRMASTRVPFAANSARTGRLRSSFTKAQTTGY